MKKPFPMKIWRYSMARVVSSKTVFLTALILSVSLAPGFAQTTPQTGPQTGAGIPQTTTPQSPPFPQSTPFPKSEEDRKAEAAAQAANTVTEAIEMNVAEVEASKLASDKAQDPQVKDFAEMMIKDHTEALSKLRPAQGLASADVKPSAKHRRTVDRLAKLSGAEFDREYMKAMVNNHQTAVKFFQKHAGEKRSASSASTDNQDFAQTAQELLPTVRRHLDMAKQIQKELESVQKELRNSGANSSSRPASKQQEGRPPTTNPANPTSPNSAPTPNPR
jgi:putative membrane protein